MRGLMRVRHGASDASCVACRSSVSGGQGWERWAGRETERWCGVVLVGRGWRGGADKQLSLHRLVFDRKLGSAPWINLGTLAYIFQRLQLYEDGLKSDCLWEQMHRSHSKAGTKPGSGGLGWE